MQQDNAQARVQAWLEQFDRALSGADTRGVLACFDEACFWRDILAFSWNLITLEGRSAIADMLEARLTQVSPGAWQIDGAVRENGEVLEAWLSFATAQGRGIAHLRLRQGKAWTLLTTLQGLHGHEEPHAETRPLGVAHGVHRDRQTWLEAREQRRQRLGETDAPYVLIVGGGQGGIALAARFKRLGVPALVIDRNPKAGDAWRQRYKSLCLHDPVWYDHLPYLPFPDHWPVFTPKDKMGDWLEAYVSIMEIDYWGSTRCEAARYDAASGTWEVQVTREGRALNLKARHLVLATGMSGMPQVPQLPGAQGFEGEQMHSSAYRSGAAYAGKQCIVVGSNNSAHDICADLWEHEAQVTMLQRSSTLVARSDTLMETGWGKLFSEKALRAGITTERADLTLASMPIRVMETMQKNLWREIRQRDAAFYERLSKAGFLLDFGEDETGLSLKYLRRGSGYYIDVGASELVADGRIALRSPVQIRQIRPRSVVLDDGSELPADLIVYATGFGPMSEWAEKLISREVADQVGLVWGMGSGTTRDPGPWEGELRNMWKPTAHPALWFHGGNLQQSRSYSLYLALQIKARYESLPTPVYGQAPVHHPGSVSSQQ